MPAPAIGVLALAAAVLVLTGVLIQTGRYAPPSWIGAAILLAGAVPLVWAGFRQLRPLDETGARPAGEALFRASLPGGRDLILRTFGPPPPSSGDSIAPIGEDFDAIGGPPFIATPGARHETLRYSGRSYLVSDGRVYGVVITDEEAETGSGVGVGDNLDVAKERYRGLDCGIARADEYRTFPYCMRRAGPQAWLWFGQDPIRSIVSTSTELGPE